MIRLFLFVLVFDIAYANESILYQDGHVAVTIPIQSWKSLRDFQVVKQDLDYSCGAASLATILNEHYGLSVTEEEILKIMDKEDMRASLEDMANALTKLGFRGVGYAASFEQLTKLKIPVIVYTKHRKDDHFSVLRGIDKDTVWLADPSLGNSTYSKHQFLEMWETREGSNLKGKILAIIPLNQEVSSENDFFTTQPTRQSAAAAQQQRFRNMP
ncbi:MAG: Lactococcin-G-processing and transport ATP-binding protein LagD [Pseudomonadota bacterium]|jgi:predicted double-glycine peptidase